MISSGAPASCSNSSTRAPEHLYLSTAWYLFLAATTVVGLLVSLVSNLIIIYLFISTPVIRHNPSNIIAVNLSVSDLLYCLQWPSVIYCSLTQSTWILHIHPICQVFGFITVSTGLASVLTVLVMSVERAFVIRNPLKSYSTRLAWFINLLIWLVCIVSSLPPLFGKFNRFTLDPSKTSCTLDYLSANTNYKLYIVVLCVIYWILPFIAISISYALIFITFKKSSISLTTVNQANSAHSFPANTSRRLLRHTPNRSGRAELSQSFQGKSLSKSGGCWVLESLTQARRSSVNEVGSTERSHRLGISVSEQVSPSQNNSFFSADTTTDIKGPPTNTNTATREQAAVALGCLMNHLGPSISNAPTSFFSGKLLPSSSSSSSSSQPTRQQPQLIQLNETHRKRSDPSATSWRVISKLGPTTTQHSSYSRLSRARLQFRLARMSLYLILLWLISWTPIALISLLNSLLHCHRASVTSIFIANTMTKLGPTFDVFIYGISHPKIKCRFKQVIGKLFRVITFRC